MIKLKTITENYNETFDARVNELLADGYKILNVNVGIRQYPDGLSDLVYQAILIKQKTMLLENKWIYKILSKLFGKTQLFQVFLIGYNQQRG